jgi:hypothetical protein
MKEEIKLKQVEPSIKFLLSRGWFRRTWVIQEVAVSRQATIQCGNRSLPWETFASIILNHQDQMLSLSSLCDAKVAKALRSIATIEKVRRSHHDTHSRPSFSLILASLQKGCTKPADKIFALLGLAEDWQNDGPFDVDYLSPHQEVYWRFVKWDITRHQNLRVLSAVSDCDSITTPSWVPNFERQGRSEPLALHDDTSLFAASGLK